VKECSEEGKEEHYFGKDEQRHTGTKAVLNLLGMISLRGLLNDGQESEHRGRVKTEEADVNQISAR
jgi:hypothetical protein